MKREVERTKKMPSFSLNLGEFEELWNRMSTLFSSDSIHCSIDIDLSSERLEFTRISELKEYTGLPDRITSFSMYLSSGGKRISIRTGSLIDTNMVVRATSDSEAWCAGAIETINSYLNSYKKWYSWFNVAPIGWFLIVFGNLPTLVNIFLPKDFFNKTAVIAWVTTLITIGVLYFFRGKLFPGSILVVRNNENLIRKYSAEFSLVIALLSIFITIIGWFVAK